MWRSWLWLLYGVSTPIRSTPALTRFDNAKSINLYSPPNGTAGLARSRVSGERRLPSPPASTMPSTFRSAILRSPSVGRVECAVDDLAGLLLDVACQRLEDGGEFLEK